MMDQEKVQKASLKDREACGYRLVTAKDLQFIEKSSSKEAMLRKKSQADVVKTLRHGGQLRYYSDCAHPSSSLL